MAGTKKATQNADPAAVLQAEIDDLKEKLADAENAADEDLKDLENKLDKAQARVNELEQALKESTRKIEDQEKEKIDLERIKADLDTQLKEQESELTKANSRSEEAEGIIQGLKEKLEASGSAPAAKSEPKPVLPPTDGDCRSCVHFPENAGESGRVAEGWASRTKVFTIRPCGTGSCLDKSFEARG
jgi:TolA-binding protein